MMFTFGPGRCSASLRNAVQLGPNLQCGLEPIESRRWENERFSEFGLGVVSAGLKEQHFRRF
jgi:hypothetical protein